MKGRPVLPACAWGCLHSTFFCSTAVRQMGGGGALPHNSRVWIWYNILFKNPRDENQLICYCFSWRQQGSVVRITKAVHRERTRGSMNGKIHYFICTHGKISFFLFPSTPSIITPDLTCSTRGQRLTERCPGFPWNYRILNSLELKCSLYHSPH